jgi:hypothetical protein
MIIVSKIALAGLVLMGFALAMSRRSLGISTALCFLALGFLVAGFVVWLRL